MLHHDQPLVDVGRRSRAAAQRPVPVHVDTPTLPVATGLSLPHGYRTRAASAADVERPRPLFGALATVASALALAAAIVMSAAASRAAPHVLAPFAFASQPFVLTIPQHVLKYLPSAAVVDAPLAPAPTLPEPLVAASLEAPAGAMPTIDLVDTPAVRISKPVAPKRPSVPTPVADSAEPLPSAPAIDGSSAASTAATIAPPPLDDRTPSSERDAARLDGAAAHPPVQVPELDAAPARDALKAARETRGEAAAPAARLMAEAEARASAAGPTPEWHLAAVALLGALLGAVAGSQLIPALGGARRAAAARAAEARNFQRERQLTMREIEAEDLAQDAFIACGQWEEHARACDAELALARRQLDLVREALEAEQSLAALEQTDDDDDVDDDDEADNEAENARETEDMGGLTKADADADALDESYSPFRCRSAAENQPSPTAAASQRPSAAAARERVTAALAAASPLSPLAHAPGWAVNGSLATPALRPAALFSPLRSTARPPSGRQAARAAGAASQFECAVVREIALHRALAEADGELCGLRAQFDAVVAALPVAAGAPGALALVRATAAASPNRQAARWAARGSEMAALKARSPFALRYKSTADADTAALSPIAAKSRFASPLPFGGWRRAAATAHASEAEGKLARALLGHVGKAAAWSSPTDSSCSLSSAPTPDTLERAVEWSADDWAPEAGDGADSRQQGLCRARECAAALTVD